MAREKARGPAAALDLLMAGCLFGFLVTVSPHLVSHAFDEGQHDGHRSTPTCLLYAQSQLATGEMQLAPIRIAPPAPAEILLDERQAAPLSTSPRYAIRLRAPPRSRGWV